MSDFIEGLRATAAAAAFPTQGTLTLLGLNEPVQVSRDAWGALYLKARSQDDLWFAQGAATAGERLFQLDMILRSANGCLSEVFSARTLAEDRFARTIGLHRAAARLVGTWTEQDHMLHARFREGIFAWIEAMPARPVEYALLDLDVDLPRDEVSWAAAFCLLGWGLSGNWDTELLRSAIREAAGDDAVAVLLPPLPADPPEVPAGTRLGAIFDALPRSPGTGSNDWVVAGSRTVSGSPLLANDPHLLAQQPAPWIEVHLSAPGYRVRGVALPFAPGVLLGATSHHAWGVTNVTGDVQDLFIEHLDEDGAAAEFDGAWEPLRVHRETIAVRGEDDVELEVRETRHGPLVDTFPNGIKEVTYEPLAAGSAVALRWTGAEGFGVRPSLVLEAAAAANFADFRTAALGLTCPGQNFVYADVDGTIGYCCSGSFPVRRTGDGTVPVPGWTSEHEWIGWVPPEELPWAENPECGFLATANNRMHDDDYPHLIGRDFHTPYRVRRIVERLAASDAHDVASMAALQVDTVSQASSRTAALLLARVPTPHDGVEREALDLLAGWDGDLGPASAPAAVFNVWSRRIAHRVLVPLLGEELTYRYHGWREAFQCEVLPELLRDRGPEAWLDARSLGVALTEAVTDLRASQGDEPSAWRWGSMHRLRLAHPLASIPGLDALFLAADEPIGGDEQTVMQTGFDGRAGWEAAVIPSWRAVWDLGDLDRSVAVLPSGNSGNPSSPHWNDQTADFLAGGTHPMPFSDAAIEAALVSRMRLLPG
jgi:penicillin amidase